MKYLEKEKEMSEAKEVKSGKVISSLVKEYQAIIAGNESAIRSFIKKAHKTPARDLEATLKEASKSGAISAIRPAYANYFDLANTCLAISGAESVAVSDFMKVVAVAQRTLKKDGALELVARVQTWAQFEEKAREAEGVKKSKRAPRAGKKSGKVESNFTDLVNINSVIEFALGQISELEGDALLIAETHYEMAEKLWKGIKSTLANSKAVNSAHPVKANA